MNIQDFLKHRRTLKNIKRFNMETKIHEQNLCEHGFNVANLYILICEMLNLQYTKKEIFLVMNHDFSECYTGDLNLAIKSKVPELWDKFEEVIVPSHIPTDENIHWFFKTESKPEKYDVFLFADAYDAYLYCKEEVNMGNKYMERPYKLYRDKLNSMNPTLFYTLSKQGENDDSNS